MSQFEVLVRDDPEQSESHLLVSRLRRLGYPALLAGSPAEFLRWVTSPDAEVRAVLVNVTLEETDVAACLDAAAPAIAQGRVTGIAIGRAPSPALHERLGESGFTLELESPVDDFTLRFQLNRTFLEGRSGGHLRRELRAPFDWPVSVLAGARRKAGKLYSLSRGGAYIETTRPCMKGARVGLELPHAGLPKGTKQLSATVVHTNVPGNLRRRFAPLGMGLRFDAPSEAEACILDAIVARQSARLVVGA